MFGTEVSFLDGLMITALGMGVTFAILYFLSFLLDALRLAFYKPPQPEKPQQPVLETTAPDAGNQPSEVEQPQTDQLELIAAITAAIALTLETLPQAIAITKIVRTGSAPENSSKWNDFGKIAQFNNRL